LEARKKNTRKREDNQRISNRRGLKIKLGGKVRRKEGGAKLEAKGTKTTGGKIPWPGLINSYPSPN